VIVFSLVFMLGLIVGMGGLSLLAFIKVPRLESPADHQQTAVQTGNRDLGRLPVHSRFHGGSAEQIIRLPYKAYMERLLKDLGWEAEYAGFEGMDFFTYDLQDPERVIVGRRYKIGEFVGDQMVVATDGIVANLMPPAKAMAFLNAQIQEAEQKAQSTKKPWLKRFDSTPVDTNVKELVKVRQQLEANLSNRPTKALSDWVTR
jgi:hypothetical protein